MIIKEMIQDLHKQAKEDVFVVDPKIIFWIHVLLRTMFQKINGSNGPIKRSHTYRQITTRTILVIMMRQ